MKSMFRLLLCCALAALLAVGAQAQEKKGKGKKKAEAAQTAKKGGKKNGAKKAAAPKPKKELTPEQLGLMEQAMPKAPMAKPKKAHKVLVFTLCKGFVHDAVPVVAKALEMMGQKTGAFEAVVSDNLDMFLPEKLAEFDGVIMDNTTGRYYFHPPTVTDKTYKDLSPEAKKEADEYAKKRQDALAAFVKGGKALIGVHAATDCAYDTWPEYGEMMGGYFAGHPWKSGTTVPVNLDLPDHVINKPFGGKGFQVADEIYIFKEPYSREKLLVLLSLDTPNMPPPNTASNKLRPDGDHAVSWVHKYGEGRVFYCSLGHDWPLFWNAPILEHYLRGIQYALGDLDAPDDPKLNKK